jgi:hypothetical protein
LVSDSTSLIRGRAPANLSFNQHFWMLPRSPNRSSLLYLLNIILHPLTSHSSESTRISRLPSDQKDGQLPTVNKTCAQDCDNARLKRIRCNQLMQHLRFYNGTVIPKEPSPMAFAGFCHCFAIGHPRVRSQQSVEAARGMDPATLTCDFHCEIGRTVGNHPIAANWPSCSVFSR